MLYYGNSAHFPLSNFTVNISQIPSLPMQVKPMKDVLLPGEQVPLLRFNIFFIVYVSNFVIGPTAYQFRVYERLRSPSGNDGWIHCPDSGWKDAKDFKCSPFADPCDEIYYTETTHARGVSPFVEIHSWRLVGSSPSWNFLWVLCGLQNENAFRLGRGMWRNTLSLCLTFFVKSGKVNPLQRTPFCSDRGRGPQPIQHRFGGRCVDFA